jgi:hypothetical protein
MRIIGRRTWRARSPRPRQPQNPKTVREFFIHRGRGMTYVPASQLGHNTGTVSVCVFLGPNDPVPDAVVRSIKELRAFCEHRAGHPLDVRPHSSVTSTECPGPRLLAIANRL